MKKLVLLFLVIGSLFGSEDEDWDTSTAIENTSIYYYLNTNQLVSYYENKQYLYNRFRTFLEVNDKIYDDFDLSLKFEVDAITFRDVVNNTPLQDDTIDIYRGFVEYIDNKHQFVLGKQTVPLGVGKLYSPINIFNPIDATSIEIDYRSSITSAKYEYAIDDLSTALIVYSPDALALKYKSFLDFAEIGLVYIDNRISTTAQNIFGYELEARVFDSSLDFKSESVYIHQDGEDNIQAMVGFDYGWDDNLFTIEYLYDKTTETNTSIAASLFAQFWSYWSIGVVNIYYFENKQDYIMPSLSYGFSDENSIRVGAALYTTFDSSYSNKILSDSYFVNLVLNF